MKLAVTIADTHALPSAFVVWRGFEDSIRKAADYGYQGVELALKDAQSVDRNELQRLLDKYNLEVSAISTGQVYAASGLNFTDPDPAIRKEAQKVFHDLVVLAGDFGRIINIGRARGSIWEGQSQEEAENLFLEAMEEVCEVADKHQVTIIVEPVNRYEINFINNLDQGAALLDRLNKPNCGLMPDVFHMNIEDDFIGKSLIRNARYVKYIHLADSNRHAPGQGHTDFSEIFDALHQIDYDGWISIEILPIPEPDTAARQAAEYLLPRIAEYNRRRAQG